MPPVLPLYKCHKTVRAAKITQIEHGPIYVKLHLAAPVGVDAQHIPPIEVPASWVSKFHPKVGGYYVAYRDGYTSFSPAEAFEDGYSLVEAKS